MIIIGFIHILFLYSDSEEDKLRVTLPSTFKIVEYLPNGNVFSKKAAENLEDRKNSP